LFPNNRNQAIRIPVEFELPGSEAIISRDGDRLIIEPVRTSGLAALLDSWEPLAEKFPRLLIRHRRQGMFSKRAAYASVLRY